MPSTPVRILCVVGARPNYMKVAPILRELGAWPGCRPLLVHTGQHYDSNMNDVFFEDLELPAPDLWLGVGSGSHAEQTARIMVGFDSALEETRPDLVVVAGDVNSTLACALVAAKRLVPVAHVEAGLRSFDRTMPEEINRVLTDALAEWLFTPSEEADENLRREGIPAERIHRVGNVMADSLAAALPRTEARRTHERLALEPRGYGLMTLHRPRNVDGPESLAALTRLFEELAALLPLAIPLHPRTRASLERFDFLARWESIPGLRVLPPLGYLDFLSLLRHARYAITDSGGIQEETTLLGIPCLTLRPNTERPVTVTLGTNLLIGDDLACVCGHVRTILAGRWKAGAIPPLWDGRTAGRIVEAFRVRWEGRGGS